MTITQFVSDSIGRNKYIRQLVMGGAFVAVIVAIIAGYMWYTQSQNEQAQALLSRSMEMYKRGIEEKDSSILDEADQSFSQGYKNFSGTSLAPFFLVYRSEIALRQNRQSDAGTLLEEALTRMSSKSPLYVPYKIKLALLKVDSADKNVVQSGKELLDSLAADVKSKDRDMALYYKGLLHFNDGDRKSAETVWDVLTKRYGSESVWVQAAQAKLDYLA